MGNRRGQLVLLIATLAGTAPPPASASANPVLARITRTVTGESALVALDPDDEGTDPSATRSLQALMRDSATGGSISPAPELLHFLAELARAFPGRAISIVQGYADPTRIARTNSHTQGRALDLRMPGVDCAALVHFVEQRPRLVARIGCFPNATFVHVDVGRIRGIWVDGRVGQ